MKKIISFISEYGFEIFTILLGIVLFAVAALPLTIALARACWEMALNTPLSQY